MDPLELFDLAPAALATARPDGTPIAALVRATPAPERLVFESAGLPSGARAVLRAEDVVTEPLEGVRFVRWAEASGTLEGRGLRIEQLAHEDLQLAVEATSRAALLEALWRRGLPGDARAIDLVRAANPGTPTPAFLSAPEGVELRCALTREERERAANLLVSTYWNEGVPRARLAAALHASTASVGARDGSGRLVAHARALCDRTKYAWIYDVVVEPSWRGRGLGQAVMRLLLDHPLVRDAFQVLLATRDAQGLYARFGFVDRRVAPPLRSWVSTEMVLRRPR